LNLDRPRDKSILLTEWLGYGVERVPRLYEEMKDGRIRACGFTLLDKEAAKR